MRFITLQKFRKLFGVLVAAVVLMLLVVSLFVAHVLNQSRLRYYASAEETSHNLVVSLENFLHSHFQEVELAMRRADLEFRRMHEQKRFSDAAFSAYLRELKERVPQAQAVRGSNAAGMVIYGEQVDLANPQDLTIREFYARVQNEHQLVFGVPVQSRISGEWVLPLVYPLTLPNGGFGGTAYVVMNSARISEAFAGLNIGAHGSIVLLDDRRRVLHRYPEVPDMLIGSTIKVNPATQALLDGKHKRASYTVRSLRDGLERTVSVEKVGAYPVYIVVGLASDDFLAPWRREVRNALLFLCVLVGLSAALLLGVRYGLNKQYDALSALGETDRALQASLARLTASESRWRSLTEGLPQMVWTATPELRIDFLSHHWESFSGVPAEQLLASGDWSAVIHPEDLPLISAAWQRALDGGEQFRCDCRLRRHDGEWRIFDHHALPQKDGNGVILSWVGSSTDRTEARAAHAALLQAKEAADQAGRAKSDFVANMSHEIRSPMNAVLGMLQLLRQTEMNARQQDYVGKAHAAAGALLGLLNDVLDFSKVEAGKLALDPHPFRLDKLWRDLAVILSANVGSRNIEVLFRIAPELPALVVGDALRLQQVLLNLAGNAIKFTERGEVVVSAQLVAQQDGTLTIAFAIRDTGIGIAPEQCEHIFDGFSQAEASTARRYGGTGLGLAISQRLVRLMGGTLRVVSEPGHGSVFDFTIELGLPEQPPELAAPADAVASEAQQAAMRGLSCLVVDDNPVARTVLREMASSFGWRVDVAADGLEALDAVSAQLARRKAYDVVFIDWRMPGLDGWETSCRIRAQAPQGKTPLIVMVTAHDRELLAQRSRDMAPVLDGFVVKPVTASMLFDAVVEARMEQRKPLALVSAPAQRRLAGVRLLLVDDNAANQQVASELLGSEGAQVVVASSGAMALGVLNGAGPLPDLILMDIQMPEMDGYQATRAIQARLGMKTPPIVAMTANALASDRIAALEAGMADHVGKPFDLAQLVEVILQHARHGGAASANGAAAAGQRGAAAPDAAATSAGATTAGDEAMLLPDAGLNSVAALKRMGGLESVYLIALRSFVAEAEKLAHELHAARRGQDSAAALPALHTLKGLAGTVGADRLATLSQLAERALKQDATAWAPLDRVLDACPEVAGDIEQLLTESRRQ
ncbi:PAS domain S-box-containing protein [Duganella sp. CF402]|uniref:response regulator n=1 Tax=unclassified Duganella TaxID=2636909 RepID=UPI0008C04834|nr:MULTISPECIES: response regulator [unclassified Duganella]RZT11243.1 PAS domain S-box-containing protein [Duganella sp. BK701]SEK74593.1 PAS domain S-box-containing protein [Duganella sp. CF402]